MKAPVVALAKPSQAFVDAIALLVAFHGARVTVPVAYGGQPSLDTAETLDDVWKPHGVRVCIDMKARYFARRVQEERAKAGMPAHQFIQDFITFEPEQ